MTRLVKQIRRRWLLRYVRIVKGLVGQYLVTTRAKCIFNLQKSSNNMSGSEMQREKERVAAKMREKQAAGQFT